MLVHITSCLNEHTAGTTGRIQELLITAFGVKNIYHVTNNSCRCIECTTVFTFRQCEVAQEVFVNLTKDINGAVLGNILKDTNNI